MKFSVVHAGQPHGRSIELSLPEPLTVNEAVAASRLAELFPYLNSEPYRTGIYGRLCDGETPVSEGDRVEIYLPAVRKPSDDDDDE